LHLDWRPPVMSSASQTPMIVGAQWYGQFPSGLRHLQAIYREKGQHLQKVLSGYTESELRLIGSFFETINSIDSKEWATSARHKTGRRPPILRSSCR
jgi:hypothetical protein